MPTPRTRLIHLAQANPTLRPRLLPILSKKTATGIGFPTAEDAVRGLCMLSGIPDSIADRLVASGRSESVSVDVPEALESLIRNPVLRLNVGGNIRALVWEYRTLKSQHKVKLGEVYEQGGEWIVDATVGES